MIGGCVKALMKTDTKFPASVMVLGIVSNEGGVMPSHYIYQGARVNVVAYTEVLERVVKPWITTVACGRQYVFLQDSASSHRGRTTQVWMAENFHDHVTLSIWSPSSQFNGLLCVRHS